MNLNLRNTFQWNLKWNLYVLIQENAFEIVIWKYAAILSQPQCVKFPRPSFSWNHTFNYNQSALKGCLSCKVNYFQNLFRKCYCLSNSGLEILNIYLWLFIKGANLSLSLCIYIYQRDISIERQPFSCKYTMFICGYQNIIIPQWEIFLYLCEFNVNWSGFFHEVLVPAMFKGHWLPPSDLISFHFHLEPITAYMAGCPAWLSWLPGGIVWRNEVLVPAMFKGHLLTFNSSPPSAAYMHKWIRPALV